MAKSQKHGNREVRKPKMKKPVALAAVASLSTGKETLAQIGGGKKKN